MALPTNPVGVYWPNFGSVTRLNEYPNIEDDGNEGYNVLILFSAYPAEGGGGTTGAVTYVRGSMSTTAWDNRVADIATMRAKGVTVLLSVGGASRQVYVTSQARADALFESLQDINEELGGSGTTRAIDGIDWNNFELGGSDPVWMTYVSLRLKDYYGSDFIISAPPAAFPPLTDGSQVDSDRELLATMHRGGTYGSYTGTALDWFCPQFYDGINTQTHITNALNYYDNAVTIAGDSAIGTTGDESVTLPNSKMGIGFGLQTPTWSDSGYWTAANAATAYETTLSNRGEVRGGFNWAAQLDLTHLFATNLGPVINPDGGGGGPSTLTTIKTFNTKARATLKRINGILVSAIKSWNNKQ